MGSTLNQVRCAIDPEQMGPKIDSRLFGHNLEHTRSCMWRGLCAELLRNRKFAGKPQQLSGVAHDWYPIGPPQTFFWVDPEESYTRRYLQDQLMRSRRHNAQHSQLIQGCVADSPSGIGQDCIPLEDGVDYEVRLVARGTGDLPVTLTVLDENGYATFVAERQLSEQWQTHRFALTSAITGTGARLELTFTGIGELRLGAVSLIRADHFHGMRRDVIELLSEIGAPVLRWPGGNFAGDYRWQDGLLEVDMRPPLNTWHEVETLPHTNGFDFHEIGIDEFMALCNEVEAEAFISINLAWDRPEESAAWVEYCNGDATTEWGRLRAQRGHPEPYGVRLWSLGNELGYGHMEGPNTPAAYAEKSLLAAAAMRAVDPSIELVMSGDWREEQWYSEGLPPLANTVDHIALHQYDTALSTYLGEDARAQFTALAAAPRRTEERFAEVRARVDARTPEGRFIGISFDEWNVWYAWYRTPGVAEGVYAAGMLNAFCRSAARNGVSIGCYFEPINEGAIVVEAFSSRLSPVGQAFALFKAHSGNQLLKSELDDPTLDLVASVNEVGSVVVSLVNSSPEAATTIQIEVPQGKYSRVEGILLSCADFKPASVFESAALPTELESEQIQVDLPKHSIARLLFAVG